MIVDTSAIVAILRGEPDARAFFDALVAAPVSRVSAGTMLEASIVVDNGRDPLVSRALDDLIGGIDVVIEPVTADHVTIGRAAYRDFGRGSGHPAGLNLGDCFAYALARATGEPLLFKGDDFGHTDIRPAV